MSRIGKKPITIPKGVTVDVSDDFVSIKGPKGELGRKLPRDIGLQIREDSIMVEKLSGRKNMGALWGLARTLVANMVEGVVSGFEKKLEFEGVGYRANMEGDKVLVMQLGFSHPVRFPVPEGIKISVEKNAITVVGINKEVVGNTAAEIRSLKPPEPYKGKGIRYRGEIIRRKAGKKAVGAG